MKRDYLDFNPQLTPESDKLTITGVDYLGNSMTFEIKKKRVKITLTSKQEIAPALEVVVYNKVHKLELNKPILVAKGKGMIRMTQ